MKFTNLQRKSVSLIVLVSFVALLQLWATPAPAATRTGNSETTIAQGNSGGPNFIEEESGSTRSIQKAKKFPWLFVGLGVIAIGVAVYFLVIKKTNYTLTVTLGAGCTGTPAATTSYEKGTVVSYNYTPLAGYGLVQVTVDGAAAPASGTITMDNNKTLAVTAMALDIRGTWVVNFTGSSGANTYTIVFSGTQTSGTWHLIGYSDTGTYTTNAENVNWVWNGYAWTFAGKFQTNNKMTGTHAWPDIGLSGTWTAIRQGTSSVNPPLQVIDFGTSILDKLRNK
jgi:hypothetical protein